MARPLRIEVPGGWYHITTRGNEQRPVYRDDRDRLHFLELLEEAVERFVLKLHAYVMMDNHYHLLLQLSQPNLSQSMQWLGVSYTVWFNRRHQRAGHLFQGRFKGILMESTSAWEVSRYLHLNPVRVKWLGLDKSARQAERLGLGHRPPPELIKERLTHLRRYRWSSYGAYVGLTASPKWLMTKRVLTMGGRGSVTQQRGGYQRYVEDAVRSGLPESPWEQLEGQLLLGGAEFVTQMKALLKGDEREQPSLRTLRSQPDWHQVVKAVEAVKAERWEAFRDRHGDWGRDLALYAARKFCGVRLAELAQVAGGLDYASVATVVRRFARRLDQDRSLRAKLKEVQNKLYK